MKKIKLADLIVLFVILFVNLAFKVSSSSVYTINNLPEGDPRGIHGALCPTLTWPPPLHEDGIMGTEHNPTGEPIGGFFRYSRIVHPNDADVVVYTTEEFLSALENLQSGQIMYVDDDAVIDLTGMWNVHIPGGVTIASGRGRGFSKGALIRNLERIMYGHFGSSFLIVDGPYTRITGLRVEGGDKTMQDARHMAIFTDARPRFQGTYYDITATRAIQTGSSFLEVDNSEIFGWTHGGIYLVKGAQNACIHHNYIHSNIRHGLGYGVVVGSSNENYHIGALIEGNIFNKNRHSIASTGYQYSSYEARYNLVLDELTSSAFDRHGNDGSAGDYTIIHHNTFRIPEYGPYAVGIRGIPYKDNGSLTYNNWFYKNDLAYSVFTSHRDSSKSVVWNNYQGTSPPQDVVFPVVVADFSDFVITKGSFISVFVGNSYDSENALSYVEVDFSDSSEVEFSLLSKTFTHIYNESGKYTSRVRIVDFSDDRKVEFGLPNKTFTHTYNEPGKYTVRVRVVNEHGIFSEKFYSVTVLPPAGSDPILSFWIKDTLDNGVSGYFVKEALIDNVVVWSRDISDDDKWHHIIVDLPGVSFSDGSDLSFRVRAVKDFNAPTYPKNNPFMWFDVFIDDIYLSMRSIQKGDLEAFDGYWESINAWTYSFHGDGWYRYSGATQDHSGHASAYGRYSFFAKHGGKVGYRLMSKYWVSFSKGDYAGMSTTIRF